MYVKLSAGNAMLRFSVAAELALELALEALALAVVRV